MRRKSPTVFGRDFHAACGALPPVSQRVGGDPQQPRGKGHASPLEAAKVPERLVKNVGRHVLRFFAVFHPPRHKRIDAVEVALIELGEPAGIALRRLDQQPFVIEAG